MTKKILKEILSWILVIVIAIIISQFVTRVIILQVQVPTGSMENTIMVGDKVMANRLSYLFADPQRGDIVVFPFPDDESMDYIKRIIGLPGETIEGRAGYVYVDGVALEEDYVKDFIDKDFGPYEIPEGTYFMMGDNRNSSVDARFWENKFVEKDKIKGKAIFKYPDFSWLN